MLFVSLSLNASNYKGYKLYKKNCIECHGLAVNYVGTRKNQEWKKFFRPDPLKLYTVHKAFLRDSSQQKTVEYFKGEKFQANIKNYIDFFRHFSSDSGNVPVCY